MKKLVSLLLAVVMLLSFANVAMAYSFDMEEPITRGMFVSVIYRIEKAIVHQMDDYVNVFIDVEAGSVHEEAIAWATEVGVVKGYSDTIFAPDDLITREQMATIIYRYYAYKGLDVSEVPSVVLKYADKNEISYYAVDGVKFTTAEEILTGDENNNFNPKATIIGEDLAEMMDTYYQNELTHYVFD